MCCPGQRGLPGTGRSGVGRCPVTQPSWEEASRPCSASGLVSVLLDSTWVWPFAVTASQRDLLPCRSPGRLPHAHHTRVASLCLPGSHFRVMSCRRAWVGSWSLQKTACPGRLLRLTAAWSRLDRVCTAMGTARTLFLDLLVAVVPVQATTPTDPPALCLDHLLNVTLYGEHLPHPMYSRILKALSLLNFSSRGYQRTGRGWRPR